ncbi:hypothetical protein RHGRI_006211 [Rhododendron griersonianum]|uniref:Ankyrin repeat family protein n=1 Tax=Rhododendron griersonianum TaxID=479676 RepID=A0AAV6KTY6_9ERIC|nr:hypothetical protein RHGRI_006211 [Rhododendron griersonianum]KAG5555484.1 hypothetical protein RHGRI_006211 [Rhododendron griersonianum]
MGVNSPFGCFGEVAFPLHYAAKSLSAELVQLFLSHGARTDIKLHDTRGMRGHHGLLPLEIALDVASLMLQYYPLEVIKLLARSSENVGKIAYKYAMEGKFAEFAILLMVAREKVLVPITFSTQDGDGWDGSMTLHQCLENRRLGWLRSIALLLQVFERAGNAIEECILVPQSKEEMEIDLALRLKEAGFRLKKGDFDFSIDDRMNSRVSIRCPIECLGTGVHFMRPRSLLLPDPSRVRLDIYCALCCCGNVFL